MRHTSGDTGSNSFLHRGFSSRLVPLAGMALLVLVLVAAMGCGSEPQPQASPASTSPPDSGQQASPASSAAVTDPAVADPTVTGAVQDAEPVVTGAVTEPTTVATTGPTAGVAAVMPEQPATEAAEPAATEAPPATVESAAEPAPEAQPTEAPEATVPAKTVPVPPAGVGGGYVIGEGSKATFTVNEKLAWLDLPNDAVMHTEGLTGSVFLDGQPSVIELDLHSMTSDSDRRDGYVQRRMFPDHRVAVFTVADLGELPDPLPEGEVITREVQGELTIRGVTKAITFEVEARRDPDKLFILGRTTFTWDDLEIPPPNIPGRIQVKDEVRVEVLLSAVPAGG